jgi:hypothetical protein
MTTACDFLDRHLPAEHPYLAMGHDAVAAGTCVVETPASTVSCDELLSIYRQRAGHLAHFNARHARELRDDVLRFCECSSTSSGAMARVWVFRTADAVHYNFVEHASSHERLGALRTVSRLELPTEEWDRLWND